MQRGPGADPRIIRLLGHTMPRGLLWSDIKGCHLKSGVTPLGGSG